MGVLWAIREFLPAMLRNNNGHIVTISSMASIVGTPTLTEYCASKAAASMIDECVRLESKKQGKNIKTTCICPYFINTGMFEGVKPVLFTPILDMHWVVWRIVTAIR